MSLLLPEGITHLADLPHTFFNAIQTGLGYLGFEELPKDERPPRRIWDRPDQLKEWFNKVEREREAKYGGGDAGDIRDQPIEGPSERNAAVKDVFG